MNARDEKCACVVVLGDVGRSPRMQYHALSLAREGYQVDVIGYGGSEPVKDILNNPNIVLHSMPECPDFAKSFPQLMAYVLKVIWQSLTLFCYLFFKRRSHFLIAQNPPAIPTLAVCWFYCVLASATYCVDWHNYAHTIMALKLGSNHKLVHLSEWFEGYFGRKATSSLCVTIAMKDDLQSKWGINAVTLYDRPPEAFRPLTSVEQSEFLTRLSSTYPALKPRATELSLSARRPGLLVSSTSWTEDEDFSLLVTALQHYEDTRSGDEESYPPLICVITGKGPLKQHYCDIMTDARWRHVQVLTPWLQPEDYPMLLASADLGVCLHTSSSGLDLPMKVVDMFGCCLPVLAFHFSCLKELVQHDVNSYTFRDSDQLSSQLVTWFRDFPNNKIQQQINDRFKKQLDGFQKLRWHENWTNSALRLFQER